MAPHDWIEGLPAGYREQNPAQWIDAVDRAVRQCLAALGTQKDRVAAIGVAGPSAGWCCWMKGTASSARQTRRRSLGQTPGG